MTTAKSLDTIARKHTAPHKDPTGFRVLRGTAVLGWWSCHECPARLCPCFDRASKLLRKSGAPARLETLDGVVLASMKPTTGGKPVRLMSIEEHRAQPRRVPLSVDEVADEDGPLEEPTDEPGGDDGDESVDDAGEVE